MFSNYYINNTIKGNKLDVSENRYAIVPKDTLLNLITSIDFCFSYMIIPFYNPKKHTLLQLVINDKKEYTKESFLCLSVENPDFIVLNNPNISSLK